VEVLDNVLDANAHAWQPLGHVSGIVVCQGNQDWTIRGNVLIDLGVRLQPFARRYPFERTLDRSRIDRDVLWEHVCRPALAADRGEDQRFQGCPGPPERREHHDHR
jgi:hypothetical protein